MWEFDIVLVLPRRTRRGGCVCVCVGGVATILGLNISLIRGLKDIRSRGKGVFECGLRKIVRRAYADILFCFRVHVLRGESFMVGVVDSVGYVG